MKRRVRQNVWGNWRGYEGTRCTQEFGTDEIAAGYWLLTGSRERNAGYSSDEMIQKCRAALRRSA